MEGSSGILGRVGEKVLGWIALGLLLGLAFAIYKMGPDGRAALWSGVWRTVVWLVIVAGLPWSARLFIRRVLEVGANWAGVVLLGALVAADAVAGLLLLGRLPSGAWSWAAAITALAVAGTYNFLVAEYLSQQAEA